MIPKELRLQRWFHDLLYLQKTGDGQQTLCHAFICWLMLMTCFTTWLVTWWGSECRWVEALQLLCLWSTHSWSPVPCAEDPRSPIKCCMDILLGGLHWETSNTNSQLCESAVQGLQPKGVFRWSTRKKPPSWAQLVFSAVKMTWQLFQICGFGVVYYAAVNIQALPQVSARESEADVEKCFQNMPGMPCGVHRWWCRVSLDCMEFERVHSGAGSEAFT